MNTSHACTFFWHLRYIHCEELPHWVNEHILLLTYLPYYFILFFGENVYVYCLIRESFRQVLVCFDMWDFTLKKTFWSWRNGIFSSVFASGAITLFRSGLMTNSSCTRGVVSWALCMCPAGWGVVEKVPLLGVPIRFSPPTSLRGFREAEGEAGNSDVRKQSRKYHYYQE